MVTELWARLEDPKGRVVGPDPAWRPQRQFLWEVVHDTRGVLRGPAMAEDLEFLRGALEMAPGGTRVPALEPRRVADVFARIGRRYAELGDAAPRFRLVAPEGSESFAVVTHFEEDGAEYALVGGWTGPVLRRLSPEPDNLFVDGHDTIVVGRRRFAVRGIPIQDYFKQDLDALEALLRDADARGLRVRLLQR